MPLGSGDRNSRVPRKKSQMHLSPRAVWLSSARLRSYRIESQDRGCTAETSLESVDLAWGWIVGCCPPCACLFHGIELQGPSAYQLPSNEGKSREVATKSKEQDQARRAESFCLNARPIPYWEANFALARAPGHFHSRTSGRSIPF